MVPTIYSGEKQEKKEINGNVNHSVSLSKCKALLKDFAYRKQSLHANCGFYLLLSLMKGYFSSVVYSRMPIRIIDLKFQVVFANPLPIVLYCFLHNVYNFFSKYEHNNFFFSKKDFLGFKAIVCYSITKAESPGQHIFLDFLLTLCQGLLLFYF